MGEGGLEMREMPPSHTVNPVLLFRPTYGVNNTQKTTPQLPGLLKNCVFELLQLLRC